MEKFPKWKCTDYQNLNNDVTFDNDHDNYIETEEFTLINDKPHTIYVDKNGNRYFINDDGEFRGLKSPKFEDYPPFTKIDDKIRIENDLVVNILNDNKTIANRTKEIWTPVLWQGGSKSVRCDWDTYKTSGCDTTQHAMGPIPEYLNITTSGKITVNVWLI